MFLFDGRSTAEVTTDEEQNRNGGTLSGLFLKMSLLKLTTRERVMKRQKRDNEHRTADNPKRGAHTN